MLHLQQVCIEPLRIQRFALSSTFRSALCIQQQFALCNSAFSSSAFRKPLFSSSCIQQLLLQQTCLQQTCLQQTCLQQTCLQHACLLYLPVHQPKQRQIPSAKDPFSLSTDPIAVLPPHYESSDFLCQRFLSPSRFIAKVSAVNPSALDSAATNSAAATPIATSGVPPAASGACRCRPEK
jgi:hypothetical protein